MVLCAYLFLCTSFTTPPEIGCLATHILIFVNTCHLLHFQQNAVILRGMNDVLLVVRRALPCIAVTVAVSLFAPCATGQPDAASLRLASQMELARLVDLAAARLGIAVEYDPALLKVSVTVRLEDSLNDAALWDMTNQVLATRGFTTILPPGARAFSVVKLAEAASSAAVEDPTTPAVRFAPGFTSRLLPVKHLRAKDAADALKPLSGKAGGVITVIAGENILISDLTPRVAAAQAFLAQLDQRESVSMRVYTARHFPLSDVAQLIARTVGERAASDERWRLVEDPLTHSLIVTATASQHADIEQLIGRLDDQPATAVRPLRTYAIKNRPVRELLGTLNALISAGALNASSETSDMPGPDRDSLRRAAASTTLRENGPGTPIREASGRAPGESGHSAIPQDRGIGEPRIGSIRLSLTADEPTNSLLAVGEPAMLSQLESMLRTLDVRQPQVMVEVLLVSLTDTDTLNLGIELEKLDQIGDTALKLASLFGFGAGGGTLPASGIGGTVAVFNPGEFSMLVRAVQSLNEGRSISMPKVLVNNNQPASFTSTLQQPFQTSNATNSSTVISYGGFESAGTTISVTPQISEGDHLVLTYKLSLSSFVGAATNGLPPPRQENSVDSVATIPDGYTVAVGGLELLTESKAETRVPFLGAIPGLGELFKQRNTSDGATRFYVFIRANVMRHPRLEDLRFLTEHDLAAARLDDGTPKSPPRVIR